MQPPQSIAPEKLAELERLKNDMGAVVEMAGRIILRLDGAEEDSLRARVCDRLRCVLQDSLSPGFQDLASILLEAQGGGMA